MCGIVGLLLKEPSLRDRLGELMTPMLIGMTDRGPDSAGVAIFGAPETEARRLSLFWREGEADWKQLSKEFAAEFDGKHKFTETGQHAILVTRTPPDEVRAWLADAAPQIYVLSVGR